MLNKRGYEILVHCLWMILFALAILLYKERLFADASYYFIQAINSGSFHVEHGRIVLGISQILPLIGYYLHLPLQFLMLLSSLGHELYYYALFLISWYLIKDKTAALIILLSHVIGQLWLYYSPMLEICYGAAMAITAYAILRNEKYKQDAWLLFYLFLLWFSMSSHPENFFILGLMLVYDFLNRGFQKRIHGITFFFLLTGLIIEILTFSEYETGHVQVGNTEPGAGFLRLFESDYASEILQLFWNYFPELLFISTGLILLAFFQKEWKKAGLLLLSCFGLIALINHVATANVFARYFESMYNPLVSMVLIIGLYEFLNARNKLLKKLVLILIPIVVAIRIVWIYDFGEILRQRSLQMERMVDYAQSLGHSKYFLDTPNMNNYYSIVTWANPIETLLYSAIDGADKAISIEETNVLNFNNNFRFLNDSNYLFRRFEIWDYRDLNSRYFQLKKEAYSYLNNSNLEFDVNHFREGVSIKPLESKLKKAAKNDILIEIENRNQIAIPSDLSMKIYLSYHWYKDGELIEWDGLRTAIEVDIYSKYVQDIKIQCPDSPGEYELVPDIVIEGKAWFELGDSYPIQID